MVYAVNGSYPYSPLWLLAAGIALDGRHRLPAAVGAGRRVGDDAAGLCVHDVPRGRPGRAASGAGNPAGGPAAGGCPGTGGVGPPAATAVSGLRRPLAGAVGWAHGAHRVAHPSEFAYALALLPLVGGLLRPGGGPGAAPRRPVARCPAKRRAPRLHARPAALSGRVFAVAAPGGHSRRHRRPAALRGAVRRRRLDCSAVLCICMRPRRC